MRIHLTSYALFFLLFSAPIASYADAGGGGLRKTTEEKDVSYPAFSDWVGRTYWRAPLNSLGLKCVDSNIKARNDVKRGPYTCITAGESICFDSGYPFGFWQFGIRKVDDTNQACLFDPKNRPVWCLCQESPAEAPDAQVSHICIGENTKFDKHKYSQERPYLTFYNDKTHETVAELKCDGTDGDDGKNLVGKPTMLKVVDNSDFGLYAKYPVSVVKFKKGQTENPKDDNDLWQIDVGSPDMNGMVNGTYKYNEHKCTWMDKCPSERPSSSPSDSPSGEPSAIPTGVPSSSPSEYPSISTAPSSDCTAMGGFDPQDPTNPDLCIIFAESSDQTGNSTESCTTACANIGRNCSYDGINGTGSMNALLHYVNTADALNTTVKALGETCDTTKISSFYPSASLRAEVGGIPNSYFPTEISSGASAVAVSDAGRSLATFSTLTEDEVASSAKASNLEFTPVDNFHRQLVVAGSNWIDTCFDSNITFSNAPNLFYQIPPDPHGAAGPFSVIAVVKVAIESRSKNGTLIFPSTDLREFFPDSSSRLLFDPKIIFDTHEERFVVVMDSSDRQTYSFIELAVSKTSNPTTTTSDDWYFQRIDLADDGNLTAGLWADFPGFAFDEEAIYITHNMFTLVNSTEKSEFDKSLLWIVDKEPFYSGDGNSTYSVHDYLVESGAAFIFYGTFQPAIVRAPAGIPNDVGTFLIQYDGLNDGIQQYVQTIQINNPLGLNRNTTFQQAFVPIGVIDDIGDFSDPPNIPQLGTNATIDANNRRTLSAVWVNNELWVTFTVRKTTNSSDKSVAQWVKLATDGSTSPFLIDQGHIDSEEGIAPGAFTAYPAIDVNDKGIAAVGFAASASTIYAGAYATVRDDNTDPAGTFRAVDVVHAGEAPYLEDFDSGRIRWGDYTGMAMDPVDTNCFWAFNQWAAPVPPTSSFDGEWATTWARLCLAPDVLFWDPDNGPNPNFCSGISSDDVGCEALSSPSDRQKICGCF